MYFLYKTLTWLALLGAPIYAAGGLLRKPRGWRVIAERLGLHSQALVQRGHGGVWIQAASVGELQIAILLARRLQGTGPGGLPISLSVTTTAARRLLLAAPPASGAAFTFPLDLPPVAARVVRRLRPVLFVAVETEIWPNLFNRFRRGAIPVALINGRISDGSLQRYRRLPGLMRRALGAVHLVCARTEEDARRFTELGVPSERIRITGDVKMDMPAPSAAAVAGELLPWLNGRRVLVAGSTHAGEEEPAVEAGRRAAAAGVPATVVLAPRHLDRVGEVARFLERAGVAWCRRSRMTASPPPADPLRVVVLDTHGELAGLYATAHVALLGGTLVPVGGHNPLEAAAAGVPQVIGPRRENVREIAAGLEAAGALLPAADAGEAAELLSEMLMDGENASIRGEAGRRLLEGQRGALARTVEALTSLLPQHREA